jgi:prepilin-type N-terminal cleavage/methylation domain-containing protein
MHNTRGFTLIEILVAIAIIVVLASVLVVAFGGVFRQSERARTEATIITLRANIESFKARWGQAPPCNLPALGQLMGVHGMPAGNDVNQGIECLILALRSTREGGPYLDNALFADDERRTNLDMDHVSEEFAGARGLDLEAGSSTERFEFVDAWGNPLVYVNINELSLGRSRQTLTLADGTQVSIDTTRALEALRHPVTGQFPAGYAIWSLGPDGVNNYGRGDDITSWTKYED